MAEFEAIKQKRLSICGSLVICMCFSPGTLANTHGDDLTGLSLDALLAIEVTSVSKNAEKLTDAAAAAFVLTGEEIRASGVQTLPEALRLVPGMQVARVDAHTWAITARGFNSTLADKLEVQMDGRTLYTPLFSGVFWEIQDTFLGDVDRIEVIRGPGAALWGANAVNGVINIVTKRAAETQGTAVELAGGNETRYQTGARYGGSLGDMGHYRAYVKSSDYDSYRGSGGADPQDAWALSQAGFRTDWKLQNQDDLTVQGDIYDGEIERLGETMSGFNILGNWQRQLSDTSSLTIKAYFDQIERDIPTSFAEERQQADIEFTHRFLWGEDHAITWGGGFRNQKDDITNVPGSGLAFVPDSASLDTWNLFVQDQVRLRDDLTLTAGSKFEHNDFTGVEIQPSLRLAWLMDENRTLWGAVSRAVRTPNRIDHGFDIPGFIAPSTAFESEVVIAYELGYRWRVSDTLSTEISTFYNDLDELRGVDFSTQPGKIDNEGEGTAYGFEATAQWVPRDDLKLLFSYSYLNLDIGPKPGSTDTTIESNDSKDPEHQAFIRGTWNINSRWSVSSMLRYVDGFENQNDGKVPSYNELNSALHWKASDTLNISLVGENLLNKHHLEFGGPSPVKVERSLLLRFNWKF